MLQRCISRPLLFNLFVNNLVLFIQYSVLSNCADNNILLVSGKNKEDKKKLLLLVFGIVNNWFYEKVLMLIPG